MKRLPKEPVQSEGMLEVDEEYKETIQTIQEHQDSIKEKVRSRLG